MDANKRKSIAKEMVCLKNGEKLYMGVQDRDLENIKSVPERKEREWNENFGPS